MIDQLLFDTWIAEHKLRNLPDGSWMIIDRGYPVVALNTSEMYNIFKRYKGDKINFYKLDNRNVLSFYSIHLR